MAMFRDRKDAGEQLAKLLSAYKKQKNVVVLGLPRGGVVTAAAVARFLEAPLDVICPRKVGAPHNPELALGAITETGTGFFNESLIRQLGVSRKYLDEERAKEQKKAEMRMDLFRKGRPPLDLASKTVILVDDGLATGATMKAAILSLRGQKAKKIVVAVPVSPADTAREVQEMCDELVCMETPWLFQAVGQFYANFAQTEDTEVVEILKQFSP
jgi:putative phosphoribosyl transferase